MPVAAVPAAVPVAPAFVALSVGAGGGALAGPEGSAASCMRFNEPFGSSHVRSFTPDSDTESTCTKRCDRSTFMPVTMSCGMLTQAASEFLGLTSKAFSETFETSIASSTESFKANL